jgi:hypothetical protein
MLMSRYEQTRSFNFIAGKPAIHRRSTGWSIAIDSSTHGNAKVVYIPLLTQARILTAVMGRSLTVNGTLIKLSSCPNCVEERRKSRVNNGEKERKSTRRFRENGHKRSRTLLIKGNTSVSNIGHIDSLTLAYSVVCLNVIVYNLFADNVLDSFWLRRSLFIQCDNWVPVTTAWRVPRLRME